MVAQSSEVNNALVLLAAVGALALFGSHSLQAVGGALTERLDHLAAPELTMEGAAQVICDSARTVMRVAMPIMVLVGVVGLLCSLAQAGIVFVPKKVVPDLGNISPVRGLKNLFSLSALMRLLVAGVKIAAIALVAFFLLKGRLNWLFALVGKSAWGVLDVARRLCLSLMFRIVAAMMGIALVDYAYQRWQYEKQLRMTKAELKEEHKRDEGHPEVRGRQAQMRRSIARSRMMQAVPEADVVVANPTHIAVALRWDEHGMDAPQVVAKGRNYLAEKIKQTAREHGVPIVERRLLAQALYEAVEVGMAIPPKLYYAVAEVLAFVMRKKKKL